MKPGLKTSEFILALLVAALGGVAGSGLLLPGSTAARIVGLATAALTATFYAWTRMTLKLAQGQTGGVVTIEADPPSESGGAS